MKKRRRKPREQQSSYAAIKVEHQSVNAVTGASELILTESACDALSVATVLPAV